MMKQDHRFVRVMAAARKIPADDRVSLAFEKRIMARITAQAGPDPLLLWSRGLWRAAFACLALMLFVSAWSFYATLTFPTTDALAADLELTMMEPFQDLGNNW